MRMAGYVHRDVSAGNCLFYEATGTGKLADLEYAKRYEDVSASEPKTVSKHLGSLHSLAEVRIGNTPLYGGRMPWGEMGDLLSCP